MLKPHEQNLFYSEVGKGIYIYDTRISAKLPRSVEKIILRYDYGYMSWKKTIKQGYIGLIDAIKKKIDECCGEGIWVDKLKNNT